MKALGKEKMQNLSFPDFEVKKFEFFPKDKKLKISVEGAWLDIDGGYPLGKGMLHFNDWENLVISRFDPGTEKWLTMDSSDIDPLKDLCEVKFNNESICLYGFAKRTGHWLEWKIQSAKMSARFNG